MRPKTNLKAHTGRCTPRPFNPANPFDGSGRRCAALTGAETRVQALVAQAKTNKEIALALGISPATVKRHLENVLRKLGLKNRVEVAIYGLLSRGCPAGMHSHCPLQSWHKAREFATPKWAD